MGQVNPPMEIVYYQVLRPMHYWKAERAQRRRLIKSWMRQLLAAADSFVKLVISAIDSYSITFGKNRRIASSPAASNRTARTDAGGEQWRLCDDGLASECALRRWRHLLVLGASGGIHLRKPIQVATLSASWCYIIIYTQYRNWSNWISVCCWLPRFRVLLRETHLFSMFRYDSLG
jgi:hypothetical protein